MHLERCVDSDWLKVVPYLTIVTLWEVVIVGVLNFKMTTLHFVSVPLEVINTKEHNSIGKSKKDATGFGRTFSKERYKVFSDWINWIKLQKLLAYLDTSNPHNFNKVCTMLSSVIGFKAPLVSNNTKTIIHLGHSCLWDYSTIFTLPSANNC